MPPHGALRGRRIAVPAYTETDRLAAMLHEAGADVVRFPLMAILDVGDRGPMQAWLRELVTSSFEDLVFLTGQGVVRLMAAADDMGLKGHVLEAIGRARTITRGPKPARALYELGLSVELVSEAATVKGVIDCLRGRRLAGRTVGIQLFPDDASDELLTFLRSKGAIVHPVLPYRYEASANGDEVAALIGEIACDCFQAVVLTDPMQVERLFEVALHRNIDAALRAGLAGAQVAAVGRETAACLEAHAVAVDITPPRQYWMRHLLAALTARLGPTADDAVVTQR